ncbi:hypothetical protein ACU4HD_14185 [Cupriavidus basilensis]
MAKYQECLNDAVIAFEEGMPVCNGAVVVENAIVDCPAYRAGAEAALNFLRDHEDRAVNLADFLPAILHSHLVALGELHCKEVRAFLCDGRFVPFPVDDRRCAVSGHMGRRRGAWPGWKDSYSCACNALEQSQLTLSTIRLHKKSLATFFGKLKRFGGFCFMLQKKRYWSMILHAS